jgi:hypothetical protein
MRRNAAARGLIRFSEQFIADRTLARVAFYRTACKSSLDSILQCSGAARVLSYILVFTAMMKKTGDATEESELSSTDSGIRTIVWGTEQLCCCDGQP